MFVSRRREKSAKSASSPWLRRRRQAFHHANRSAFRASGDKCVEENTAFMHSISGLDYMLLLIVR